MRLSQLYTNQPQRFEPIYFQPGLNVVLAEINLPENKSKDTHNLGKTTLGRILDFCFLKKTTKEFFLNKNIELFEEFIFFLEIELPDKQFLTIARAARTQSKASFKKHSRPHQNYLFLDKTDWDYYQLSFDRARQLFDGLLNWRAIKPWPFRKIIGYQLRAQDDFNLNWAIRADEIAQNVGAKRVGKSTGVLASTASIFTRRCSPTGCVISPPRIAQFRLKNVFHLHKFAGRHADWKPFLAFLLGFNAHLVETHYELEEQQKKLKKEEETIRKELGGSLQDASEIHGMLSIKKADANKKQERLDQFDFHLSDLTRTEQLVDEIDQEIANLNEERYVLKINLNKINQSLEDDQILFNVKDATQLFKQAGVLFQGQIKKDFQQLIDFNRAITEERRIYLSEEQQEILARLEEIGGQLAHLNQERSHTLSFLKDTDAFNKFRTIANELITLRADIQFWERQAELLETLKNYRKRLRDLDGQIKDVQRDIEQDMEDQNADETSLFSRIRLFVNEIVEAVISRNALLKVTQNTLGHLEFNMAILDQSGKATSADLGHTYRKLLCVAFDLAVLRAHGRAAFPQFVFHDGIFESLDDRKKTNLLTVLREYVGKGLQPIITLIDSDLPPSTKNNPVFEENEIIVKLHDQGDAGRLFKMGPW